MEKFIEGFNPRTPCGVRPVEALTCGPLGTVSIHALLAECDNLSDFRILSNCCFNPRTPCGVRLNNLAAAVDGGTVSIHALLAECDPYYSPHAGTSGRFNPRTPCGVRPRTNRRTSGSNQFQSTHSLRSATLVEMGHTFTDMFQSTHSLRSATRAGRRMVRTYDVSIHALLAECDKSSTGEQPGTMSFNPRTPCGVRLRPTLYIATQQSKSYFAPTSLKRPSLHGCSF